MQIRIFCFDKTGTLTDEGLDFLGVRSVDSGSEGNVLLPMNAAPNTLPVHVLDSLATCHAVSTYGNGFVGNQVEVRYHCISEIIS